LPVALLAIVVSFLLGLVAAGSRPADTRAVNVASLAPVARTPAPTSPAAAATTAAGTPGDFATVAARLRPSIVSVYATARGTADTPVVTWRSPRDNGSEPLSNAGAGFLIQPTGYILTNAHVVAGADRVMVTLSDDRVLRADVIGADPTPGIDVALLHVDLTDGLPTVTLGKSSSLRVGEWVCAIGNPLGYTGSVTVGVVSSVDREIPTFAAVGVIQTDAAMSLGSSGGPLVNARGQVVGITTAISTDSANIGFAIPIDQVNAVLPQLRDRGRVPRGFLSLRVAALTPELRRALSVTPERGAVIEEVTADHSADRAGLRTYDVVEAVDDQPVLSDYDFVHAIAARAPGTLVKLGIWRNGVRLIVPVKLEELPAPGRPAGRAGRRSGRRPSRWAVRSASSCATFRRPPPRRCPMPSAASSSRTSIPPARRRSRVSARASSSSSSTGGGRRRRRPSRRPRPHFGPATRRRCCSTIRSCASTASPRSWSIPAHEGSDPRRG